MASFYDTAPTRFGIGPCSPAERSQQNVSRHLRFSKLRHPPASSLHSPKPPGCRTPHPRRPRSRSGLTGNFTPRISVCASFSLSRLVSLLCLCFLLGLPCHARHPGPHGNHGVPAKTLSSDISCRRTQNASVLHNHAHASGKLQRQQPPLQGCGEHFGPTGPCGGIRRSASPHRRCLRCSSLLQPSMCLILRDGYSYEFPQSWLSYQSGCGKHRRIGVGSGHRCYTSKL
jgi:hypothetical protein